jgi:hypothetical protein
MARAQMVSFEDLQSSEPSRRKRHPLRNTLVTLVVIAVLAGAGYLVAEPLAEQFTSKLVAEGIAQELGASQDDVQVDLGEGSILWQLLHRRVNVIHADVTDFSSGLLTGTAKFDATGVPLDTNQPVSQVGITVSLDSAALQRLVAPGDASTASSTTVALVDDTVRIGTSVTVLGAPVPVSVDVEPSAAGGLLVLTPKAFTIGTAHYTSAQLLASPFGGLLGGLVAPRSACVASSLPNNLDLKSVTVRAHHLFIGVAGSNLTLSSLAHKGTCPAG